MPPTAVVGTAVPFRVACLPGWLCRAVRDPTTVGVGAFIFVAVAEICLKDDRAV